MQYSLQNVFPGIRVNCLVKNEIEIISVIETSVYLESVVDPHETISVFHLVQAISDEITFQFLWRYSKDCIETEYHLPILLTYINYTGIDWRHDMQIIINVLNEKDNTIGHSANDHFKEISLSGLDIFVILSSGNYNRPGRGKRSLRLDSGFHPKIRPLTLITICHPFV